MMAALASAMKAWMTRARRSVQMTSFLMPRLCQELVRSTTQRAPAWSGKPFLLTTPCGSPQIVEGFGLRRVRDGRCGGLLVVDG